MWYDGETDGDAGQEVGHEELFVILGKPLKDGETLQEQLAAAHRPGLASDVVYKLKGRISQIKYFQIKIKTILSPSVLLLAFPLKLSSL